MLLQDVERQEDGPALRDGVSRDRIPSAHDPEMRHGRKSSRKRFDGHKAAVVVDTDSQLVTAVDILPGNADDNTGVLELVGQSEENTGIAVEETIGDAAYGDGGTRQAFADAGRTLIAKVPGRPNKAHFPKEDFHIDLEAGTCTCPAGNVTSTLRTTGTRTNRLGQVYPSQSFQFDPEVCGLCPLRSECVAAGEGKGRTIALHPQEALLQRARIFQQSENFAEYRQRPALLADWLPWAGLIGPGVVLNKDGSFQRTAHFRGPDLNSATQGELIATSARLNNALRRLGSGWALFIEAERCAAAG